MNRSNAKDRPWGFRGPAAETLTRIACAAALASCFLLNTIDDSWASRGSGEQEDPLLDDGELEHRRMFGRSVCVSQSAHDEDGLLRFVVAAPYPYAPATGVSALYVFEGQPPVHVRTLRSEPGYSGPRHVRRVVHRGVEHLWVEQYRSDALQHVYSWDGERITSLEHDHAAMIPVGDLNADGTTDFCVPSDEPGWNLVDGLTRSVLKHLPAEQRGRPLLAIAREGGVADLLVVVQGEERPLRLLRGGEGGADSTVTEFQWNHDHVRTVRAVHFRREASGEAQDFVVVSAPYWDDTVGRVFAFDASTGALLFEIEDRFGGMLKTGKDSEQYQGSFLGHSLLVGPDIDADGIPDLLVGSPNSIFVKSSVHAFSGRDGSLLWTSTPPRGADPAWLGASLDLLGDYDGDGLPDVLVGGTDITETGRPASSGSVRILSSKTGKLLWLFSAQEL